jgi:hypothetical protein
MHRCQIGIVKWAEGGEEILPNFYLPKKNLI